MERPVHGADGSGASVRGHDPGLRFRAVVEDILAGPVLGHKPVRGDLRRATPLLSLHLYKQPLRHELPLHRRRHTPKNHDALRPDALDQPHQNGFAGVDDHHLLPLHAPQHTRHGHPAPDCHVRGLLWLPHGSGRRAPVHHLVHPPPFPFRIPCCQNPHHGTIS